jgi:RimJ/RimL family protein N-acetyltransferase
MILQTARLTLRPWREDDRDDLARMCADPEVMWDYDRVSTRAESDARLDRYRDAYDRLGFGRLAVVRSSDELFLGYCGIMPVFEGHPMEPGFEIGWRMIRSQWGKGYASEAARAALRDGFECCGLSEVLSYTSAINWRSQAVMRRIGLVREPSKDYRGLQGEPWIVYVGRP